MPAILQSVWPGSQHSEKGFVNRSSRSSAFDLASVIPASRVTTGVLRIGVVSFVAHSETRRPAIATGILIVGAISHAFLCVPAIVCRGYPPIDPIWYGVTYVWPISIVISAYFDSIRFGVRRNQLIIYAIATAFFTAGTPVTIVPREMGFEAMLLGTIIFGPFHLVMTFLLEFITQVLYSMGRRLVDRASEKVSVRFSLLALFALSSWIGLIVGIPIGYRSYVKESVNHSAVLRAETDWKTNALIYRDHESAPIDGCTVQYCFDPDTGLELGRPKSDLGFADKYNARINELISQHGIPTYSIKSIIPKPEDLIPLLDSDELDPVDAFPADLTDNIHLMRRGTLSRWGGTSSSSSDSLSIVTPHILMAVDNGVLPVHSKVTDKIVYIRNGPNWVGAFLRDGRMIMSASR